MAYPAKTTQQPARRPVVGDIRAMQTTTNIDRRKCSRVVPMKVLCLGLSRTGTSSLRQALLDLNHHDVYHFASILNENPRDAEMWNDALDAKFDPSSGKQAFTRREWDQLLGHCMATTDTPTLIFYRELLQAYPEAKVILTVRDSPEAWIQSYHSTIAQYIIAVQPPRSAFGRFVKWAFVPKNETIDLFNDKVIANYDMINVLLKDLHKGTKEESVRFYENHIAEVKRLVPKENLLVMNVKEGWKPLCDFLDVKQPAWDFPRANSTDEFQRNTAEIMEHFGSIVMWNMAKTVIPAIALAVGGVAWWMRSK